MSDASLLLYILSLMRIGEWMVSIIQKLEQKSNSKNLTMATSEMDDPLALRRLINAFQQLGQIAPIFHGDSHGCLMQNGADPLFQRGWQWRRQFCGQNRTLNLAGLKLAADELNLITGSPGIAEIAVRAINFQRVGTGGVDMGIAICNNCAPLVNRLSYSKIG